MEVPAAHTEIRASVVCTCLMVLWRGSVRVLCVRTCGCAHVMHARVQVVGTLVEAATQGYNERFVKRICDSIAGHVMSVEAGAFITEHWTEVFWGIKRALGSITQLTADIHNELAM